MAYCVLAWSLLFGGLKTNSPDDSNEPKLAHERQISNQESNNFNESWILTLSEQNEVILVKGHGRLPGADGFTPNNNPRRRHPFGGPRISRGSEVLGTPNTPRLGDIPKAPKVRSFREAETRLDGRRGNRGDQCPIDEQNKAGFSELPDSGEYRYNLETKTAKKALKKVWKNLEAREEVLTGLAKMDSGELLPRNKKDFKDFKGFKELKEIKLTNTRMLVKPGQNGAPDEIVVICMRRDLDSLAPKLKNKYK